MNKIIFFTTISVFIYVNAICADLSQIKVADVSLGMTARQAIRSLSNYYSVTKSDITLFYVDKHLKKTDTYHYLSMQNENERTTVILRSFLHDMIDGNPVSVINHEFLHADGGLEQIKKSLYKEYGPPDFEFKDEAIFAAKWHHTAIGVPRDLFCTGRPYTMIFDSENKKRKLVLSDLTPIYCEP